MRGGQKNYRILARGGFKVYVYGKVGYTSQTKYLNEWKYFLDRVDLLQNSVPSGYFSVFKETEGLVVALIKSKIIVDDRTIPDISVGIS